MRTGRRVTGGTETSGTDCPVEDWSGALGGWSGELVGVGEYSDRVGDGANSGAALFVDVEVGGVVDVVVDDMMGAVGDTRNGVVLVVGVETRDVVDGFVEDEFRDVEDGVGTVVDVVGGDDVGSDGVQEDINGADFEFEGTVEEEVVRIVADGSIVVDEVVEGVDGCVESLAMDFDGAGVAWVDDDGVVGVDVA